MIILIAALVGAALGLFSLTLSFRTRTFKSIVEGHAFEDAGNLFELVLSAVPMPDWTRRQWSRAGLDLYLSQAGIEFNPAAFFGLRWVLLWVAVLLAGVVVLLRGIGLFTGFATLILIAVGWWAPTLWLRWRIDDRLRRINHGLPDLMDHLRLGLEAGLGFELALRRSVPKQENLLGEELSNTLAMLDRGHSKSEALERLVLRNPSADLRAFAAAVKQSERLGSSLNQTLRVQTKLLRSRRRRNAQEASRRLPILIVFPLVFFFLPALLIIYLGPPLLHLLLSR